MDGMPDIAAVATLIGEPARARILAALMGGQALTATELAGAAGVTKQTASAHLAKLLDARLIAVERQGRHRYVRFAHRDVAQLIEHLIRVAHRAGGAAPVRTGPREPALRKARVCFDHLAGELGVVIYEGMLRRGLLHDAESGPELTPRGERAVSELGIDVDGLRTGRRALCRACLDWSERRHHLAGAVGAALFERIVALRWARRAAGSRALHFSALGEDALRKRFA